MNLVLTSLILQLVIYAKIDSIKLGLLSAVEMCEDLLYLKVKYTLWFI